MMVRHEYHINNGDIFPSTRVRSADNTLYGGPYDRATVVLQLHRPLNLGVLQAATDVSCLMHTRTRLYESNPINIDSAVQRKSTHRSRVRAKLPQAVQSPPPEHVAAGSHERVFVSPGLQARDTLAHGGGHENYSEMVTPVDLHAMKHHRFKRKT